MTESNAYSPPPTVDVDPDEAINAKHNRPSFSTVYGGALLGGIVGSLSFGWVFGVKESALMNLRALLSCAVTRADGRSESACY